MRRYITVKGGLQKEICRIFNLSKFGAWKALNYESNSPRAYKVRKYALENGGRYEEEGLTPNCKIYTSLYGMIFTFHNGYTVAYNSLLKRINVFINGKLVDANDGADIDLLLSTIQSTLQLSEGDINPPIKNSTKR